MASSNSEFNASANAVLSRESPTSCALQPMNALLHRDNSFKNDDEDDPEKTLKIVVLGDGTVGKTSLCCRFAQRDFSGKYNQTIGIDFFSRRIRLSKDLFATFQLWDIGGQSLSANMLSKYVYDAHVIAFVYDVTNSASFDNVSDWVAVVKRITKQNEKPVHLTLIGNKVDMEHRRAVRIDKHSRLAEQYGMSSHYLSAKTGDTVDLAFKLIAADVFGVQLTKTDVEQTIPTVEAPVAVLDNRSPHIEPEIAKKTDVPQVRGVCVTRTAEGEVDLSKTYVQDSKVQQHKLETFRLEPEPEFKDAIATVHIVSKEEVIFLL